MSAVETESLLIEEEPRLVQPPLSRMVMAVLSLAGVVIAGYMLMFTVGAITTLACGNGACETVQASPWAVFLGVPVPLIGLLGYATVLAIAIAGLQPTWVESRFVASALVGLSGVAFVFSVYLSAVEAFLIHAWCRWCVASAIVATLLFLFAVPEIKRLRRSPA